MRGPRWSEGPPASGVSRSERVEVDHEDHSQRVGVRVQAQQDLGGGERLRWRRKAGDIIVPCTAPGLFCSKLGNPHNLCDETRRGKKAGFLAV